MSPTPRGLPMFNMTGPVIRDLLSGVLMIVFFYANYYLLAPKLLLDRKYLIYGLLIIVSFTTIALLPSLLTGHIPWESPRSPPNGPDLMKPDNSNFILSISHNILLFLSVVSFSIYLRIQERLFKVEKTKNEMEILSLKEQINPHFLFNTLNNIYGQAIEDNSQRTASSILKLSEMLRHVVHDAQCQWVSITKELAYMENYIQLQRQRLGESVELTYLTKGFFSESLKIAPLILIPFIENAFKHGVNPDEESLIKINISVNGNELTLLVENTKTNVRLQAHEISGTGMKITMDRLRMLYPGKHELNVEDTSTHYTVNLKLELHD
ncbi:sensor histidine kinase [Algoriphagus sp. AGSA1]|nr:sensor histidine kinase [Algoriphagus sp. AGSA1]